MESTFDDAQLVASALRGEHGAFEALVRRHLRAAYAVGLAILRVPAEAEDLAQEALMQAHEKLATCREPARFRGWLFQIVRSRALHRLDHRRVRRDADEVLSAAPTSSEPVDDDPGVRRQLLEALEALTPVQREVVLLHDLEGLTHGEIASALGLSEPNCRQHLSQARKALRRRLEGTELERAHGS